MLPMFKQVAGYDFIVNPEVLWDKQYSLRDRVEYAGLCSLRNYEDYMHKGTTYLDKDLIPPWVPTQILDSNKLIDNKTNQITLLYEQ